MWPISWMVISWWYLFTKWMSCTFISWLSWSFFIHPYNSIEVWVNNFLWFHSSSYCVIKLSSSIALCMLEPYRWTLEGRPRCRGVRGVSITTCETCSLLPSHIHMFCLHWGIPTSSFVVCYMCIQFLVVADACTSEVHPVFNPVAPYGYLLSDMYLFMADITNPDFLV